MVKGLLTAATVKFTLLSPSTGANSPLRHSTEIVQISWQVLEIHNLAFHLGIRHHRCCTLSFGECTKDTLLHTRQKKKIRLY